jgi:microcystin-dependent protein
VQGTPYVATYNNSDGAFYLQGFTANPYVIPIGGLLPYVGATAPNSAFVLPFGQAISRTTYATLFGLVGGTFGGGDGATTFNVPDLRGRAVFGLDNMGGSQAGRITAAGGNFDGRVIGNAGGAENQTLTQAQLPNIALAFSGSTQSWNVNLQGWGGNQTTVQSGGNFAATFPNANNFGTPVVTVTPSGTVTAGGSSNLGSGNAHPVLSPAMVLPFILRII